MKTITIVLFFALNFISTFTKGQRQEIKNKFVTADSILIVSHDRYRLDTIPGKSAVYRALLIDGLPNKEIVKQQFKVDLHSRNSLVTIFANMKIDNSFESAFCFDPHQAILFFEKGTCSYVDICFGCQVYSCTKDLARDENLLHSDEAFDDLKEFFISKGINFKIDD